MSSTTDLERHHRAIRIWLLAVAALIFATVVVGGATRLTESGLSIVEWKPVTGMLPPFTADEWQAEFDKYKTIPQYTARNSAMTLGEFKVIYWWEWTHRLLGRVIGAVFLLPFLCFLWVGWIEAGLRWRLWAIFALGALQGAVGWWMVASGLTERVTVSQYRLAFHLTLACVIFAAVLRTAQHLAQRTALPAPPRWRVSANALVFLVLCQIYLGALVAGLRAGLIFNTWPLIDGSLVPDAARLWFFEPIWRNVFENALMAQFNHRMMGYALWFLAVLHAIDVARTARGGPALNGALALAAAITLQAAIGIVTLLYQAPISLALLHQAVAVVVLAIAVLHAERLAERESPGIVSGQAALRPSA